jgi:predicted RNA binding protein YcfA (HicA-like mRNA interferase family)
MCKKRVDQCRTGKDFVDYATAHGAKEVRHSGSHAILEYNNSICPVPVHGCEELGKGLRCKIIKIFISLGLATIVIGYAIWFMSIVKG